MGNKTVMVAAWILMLMVIVEVPGTTFAVTEVVDEVAVVDEVGYSVRLLKAVVAPSAPSPGHNGHPPIPKVSDEINE